MAMKNDFEATSDVHSPFVDEVANRGKVSEAERAAIVANRLFLAKQAASDESIRRMAAARTATPQPKPTRTQAKGLVETLAERKARIDALSKR